MRFVVDYSVYKCRKPATLQSREIGKFLKNLLICTKNTINVILENIHEERNYTIENNIL